jgi:hypothetical protein
MSWHRIGRRFAGLASVTMLVVGVVVAIGFVGVTTPARAAAGPLAGTISGQVVDYFGDPVDMGHVEVYDILGFFVDGVDVDAGGHYETSPLAEGVYFVFFYNGDPDTFIGWFPEWYPDRPHIRFDQALPIVMTNAAGDVTGIDAQLDPLFDDMFDTVFTQDIGWLRGTGITFGCSDFLFCTDSRVDRGTMAAFLVRGLSLEDDGGGNLFIDDNNSIFEGDIDRLATAGITRGCNPPTNDRFCPTTTVTRGVMAAFLVRAMGYADDGGGNLFVDDDDSIFESDIDRLAVAGVTRGCNPPLNDQFCPGSAVTRGAMSAFLHRALGGGVVFLGHPGDADTPQLEAAPTGS